MGQTRREERLMEDEVMRLTEELDRLVTLCITRYDIWGTWYCALGHVFPTEEQARQHIRMQIR